MNGPGNPPHEPAEPTAERDGPRVPRSRWCPICGDAKAPSEEVCLGCGIVAKLGRAR